MHVSYLATSQLKKSEIEQLFAYRYAVFVRRLGWQLPEAQNDLEIDQFDRDDTIHVIARHDEGRIIGCARLLPTSSPYLLSEVFPDLMGDEQPPVSSEVWELSRFSATDLYGAQQTTWVCREIMAASVECALEHGAKRLIAVTSKGIERILNRLEINWRRTVPNGTNGPIFAFWIELDEKTLSALDLCNAVSEV